MRIEVQNLGKRFRREWIFKNLNYTFEEGQVYALIGPNGSGKSTLLQVLWGQFLPSKGSIQYFRNNENIRPEEVFPHLSIATPYMQLIEEFTLREMIEFHFKFKILRPGVSVGDVVDKIELRHASNEFIGNFSSGMRQRVKLALAFYAETDLLFLDEPTTNLDKNSVNWYLAHLEESVQRRSVFIASNQEREYPEEAVKIDLTTIK